MHTQLVTEPARWAAFDAYFAATQNHLEHGASLLGTGIYGAVYTHPMNAGRVVKFARSANDGWPLFAAFCVTSKSPHTPHVFSFRWVRGQRGERLYYVAEMERLWGTVAHLLCSTRGAVWSRIQRIYRALLARAEGSHAVASMLRQIGEEGAADVLEMLIEQRPDEPLDLHANNWMLRQDGALVLIDPFLGGLNTPHEAAIVEDFGD